jgi:hypothetical protein
MQYLQEFVPQTKSAVGHITIEYCPTEKILGDYMSKPLHGRKYNDQRDAIMNLVPTTAAQLMMFGIFAARA